MDKKLKCIRPGHPDFIGPRMSKELGQYIRGKRYLEKKLAERGTMCPWHDLFIGPRQPEEIRSKARFKTYYDKHKRVEGTRRPGHPLFIGPLLPTNVRTKLNGRRYCEENREHLREIQAAYRIKKKDRFRERKAEFYARQKQSPDFRLRLNISSRIRSALKRGGVAKSRKSADMIGCTFAELRAHIESQFLPGMSWDNNGIDGWHIDHIIPCAAFDLTDPDQQKMCFHYSNMRPLWAKDNLKKNDNLTREAIQLLVE